MRQGRLFAERELKVKVKDAVRAALNGLEWRQRARAERRARRRRRKGAEVAGGFSLALFGEDGEA